MEYSDRYISMFQRLMVLEGGAAITSPAFDGHWTRFGIIEETYHLYYPNKSVKDATEDEAMYIYKVGFWDKCKLDSVRNDSICMFLFAGAVNMGINGFVRNCVQYPLGLISDGKIGPKTLAVLNYNTEAVYNKIYAATKQRYEQIAQQKGKEKHLRGWLNRIKKIPYRP